MNFKEKKPVIITEEDYNLLRPYFSKVDQINSDMSLSAELSRATVIKNSAFPANAIGLNSQIWITEDQTGKVMELSIVLPQSANIKEKKISVLTPIAAALIGFRKGEIVQWKVPGGLKVFKITEVLPPITNVHL